MVKVSKGSEARMTKKTDAGRVKVTLVRSTIGFNRRQAAVVRGLGLRRIGHTVELQDVPSIRGMLVKVRHLVRVSDVEG
jgi:large subunit ribosomal protein L30